MDKRGDAQNGPEHTGAPARLTRQEALEILNRGIAVDTAALLRDTRLGEDDLQYLVDVYVGREFDNFYNQAAEVFLNTSISFDILVDRIELKLWDTLKRKDGGLVSHSKIAYYLARILGQKSDEEARDGFLRIIDILSVDGRLINSSAWLTVVTAAQALGDKVAKDFCDLYFRLTALGLEYLNSIGMGKDVNMPDSQIMHIVQSRTTEEDWAKMPDCHLARMARLAIICTKSRELDKAREPVLLRLYSRAVEIGVLGEVLDDLYLDDEEIDYLAALLVKGKDSDGLSRVLAGTRGALSGAVIAKIGLDRARKDSESQGGRLYEGPRAGR